MKKVVSISLGSKKRDKSTEVEILNEKFSISRIGTDGDMEKYAELLREYDGSVDAIGLGGIDLYVYTGDRRYTIADAAKLAANAPNTAVVDGSGLKNTLERRTIRYLQEEKVIDFSNRKSLMVCGVDRFGMAQTLAEVSKNVLYGDLMFVLGVPIPLRSYKALCTAAGILLPIVSRLPFQWLYPTGEKQEEIKPAYGRYYEEADVITGDWHMIRRTLPTPESGLLKGKIVVTNTITEADVELLRERELKTLVTSTPVYDGRHFATNVMEGVLISLLGKKPEQVTKEDYEELLDRLGFHPTIVELD